MGYVNYPILAKQIALRAGQLEDAIDAATFNTAFTTDDLVDLMDGLEVPFASLKRDILNVGASIATMIGLSANAQLRAAITADSTELDSGDDVPATDGSGRRFIGKFDGLLNAETEKPLQLAEKSVVLRRLRNSGSFYRIGHDIYCVEGGKVYFICFDDSSVSCPAFFRGCVWSDAQQEARFDDGEDSTLPIQVATVWQNMVLANISQENWFKGEAMDYANLAMQAAQNIGLLISPAETPDLLVTNTENRNAQSQNR